MSKAVVAAVVAGVVAGAVATVVEVMVEITEGHGGGLRSVVCFLSLYVWLLFAVSSFHETRKSRVSLFYFLPVRVVSAAAGVKAGEPRPPSRSCAAAAEPCLRPHGSAHHAPQRTAVTAGVDALDITAKICLM